MERTFTIDIDRSTWPRPPRLPRFPLAFMGVGSVAISIPGVLLEIGYLTVPTAVRGVSLSEFWAWVRYLAAFTDDDDLRLTSAFGNLDAHQKTILSDDFGMGVPMLWLKDRLDLREICDGRYFLQRYGASAGASVRRLAKRGPNKTPDFVARDGHNVWHVVECKGTQSGAAYQSTQIGNRVQGGVAQKRAIVFPPNHTGQRVVSALSIALEGVAGSTSLRIVDPEPEDPVRIGAHQLEFAIDAAQRSTLAKALRLAGYEATADVTAAPMGRFAWSRPDPRRRVDEARERVASDKRDAAREELSRPDDRHAWTFDGTRYRGRELKFDLPRPILVDGRQAFRAYVRQGINEDVLSELRERPGVQEPIPSADVEWTESIERSVLQSDSGFARLRIGQLFSSELLLGP